MPTLSAEPMIEVPVRAVSLEHGVIDGFDVRDLNEGKFTWIGICAPEGDNGIRDEPFLQEVVVEFLEGIRGIRGEERSLNFGFWI